MTDIQWVRSQLMTHRANRLDHVNDEPRAELAVIQVELATD